MSKKKTIEMKIHSSNFYVTLKYFLIFTIWSEFDNNDYTFTGITWRKILLNSTGD